MEPLRLGIATTAPGRRGPRSFRPWTGDTALADGPSILDHVRDTARELGIDARIRCRSRVLAARWSSPEARWTVRAEPADGTTPELTCGLLFVCAGYYRYDRGHTPEVPGRELFRGPVVHPHS